VVGLASGCGLVDLHGVCPWVGNPNCSTCSANRLRVSYRIIGEMPGFRMRALIVVLMTPVWVFAALYAGSLPKRTAKTRT